ncbi:MAG: TetR/AcrR family transcriptional regulator [Leptolyngbyaceae bacterium]|nr:TetR/AcrR family transcriptional regulator [Leptolyngbyaceae bacterium]
MGRHKEFNRNEVLEKAAAMFRLKGYEATSVQDLVNCMGINRGSLYDTFGDKQALFLASLDYYRDNHVSQLVTTLQHSSEGVSAIRHFFDTLINSRSGDQGCQGCLMVNTMVERVLHDTETADKISAHVSMLENAFYQALLRAQHLGEIDQSPEALRRLARYFVSSTNGLCVTAKASPDRSVLEDIANTTLSVLG